MRKLWQKIKFSINRNVGAFLFQNKNYKGEYKMKELINVNIKNENGKLLVSSRDIAAGL